MFLFHCKSDCHLFAFFFALIVAKTVMLAQRVTWVSAVSPAFGDTAAPMRLS
jgi:hypothetical protein